MITDPCAKHNGADDSSTPVVRAGFLTVVSDREGRKPSRALRYVKFYVKRWPAKAAAILWLRFFLYPGNFCQP